MFSNSEKLSGLLEKVGKEVGEPVWNMPIDNSYEKDISSDIADMKNVGSGKVQFHCRSNFYKEVY